MSTKQTTTTDNNSALNFDPASKGIYGSLTSSGGNYLNQMINNPFGNSWYQMGLGQSQKGATQQGQNNIQALLQQMKTSGMGGKAGNAFQAAQMGKIGRSNASMFSQATTGNVMNAFNRQMQATGMGMAYQPLMTGESSHGQQTQQTGGLGTWLPQLISAGLGMGTSMFGGNSSMPFTSGGAPTAVPGVTGATGPLSMGGFPINLNSPTSMPSFNPTGS